MAEKYLDIDAWSIIQNGWNPERVKSSESLFSIGNGFFGQRANFEEQYSGESFQGSYIGGIYYPDQTKVGWWKNGYPEFFAKVLNAPNWIGINVSVDGELLDLHMAKKVEDYRLELDMREGVLRRSFRVTLKNGLELKVSSRRFISLELSELGAIQYEVTLLNGDADIEMQPNIDANIKNEDSNWDHAFWQIGENKVYENHSTVFSKTNKTNFEVLTFMQNSLQVGDEIRTRTDEIKEEEGFVGQTFRVTGSKNVPVTLTKFGGYISSFHVDSNELESTCAEVLQKAGSMGFDTLLEKQKDKWAEIWKLADIEIEGDQLAQQGIRFNIFQLMQTYNGLDSRLNIGPKGFTGEKYGGSTYWDTEAYCLPFYMATRGKEVALNLLNYRYDQLGKAIENAEKLGFSDGAALYPMVTMNGEECHNEWEITFEEIHRNAAIAFAIYDYGRFTGDDSYLHEKGIEVLVAIARFWVQRSQFSTQKNARVILGVTGPNEYENNVNNNWYTNYMAAWCLRFTSQSLQAIFEADASNYEKLKSKLSLSDDELTSYKEISESMYYPRDEERDVFLQQDGFLDKELIPAIELASEIRPINQHWSWDRILRSCFIKQADVLQGFYFLEDDFTESQTAKHFDFYEPMTVHESSLSPSIHSVIAARLGRMDKAYELYLRTSRLDLDDYNHEVDEGCHITSMAGTWLSIVKGFAGMKITDGKLEFSPKIPSQWDAYSFKMNFRGRVISVRIDKNEIAIHQAENAEPLDILINGVGSNLKEEISVSL